MSNQRLGSGLESAGKNYLRKRGSLSIAGPRELLIRTPINAAYEPNGRVAEDTLRLWGPTSEVVDPVPETLSVDEDEPLTFDQEVVWAGAAERHYGHFLTEATGRLWALMAGQPLASVPAIFSSRTSARFAREWLSAFGICLADVPEGRVVRFTRMFVPEPSLRLRAWLAPEFRETHLHARRGLRVEALGPKGVVWLSRSQLSFNPRAAYDECLLEWLLRDHIELINPEAMPLASQVAAVEASTAVTGILGSAFYTMLMAEEPPPLVGICPPRVSSTYVGIARLLGVEAKFMRGLTALPLNPRRPKSIDGGFRLLIPEVLRELTATVLPELSDDPLLATLARSKRLATAVACGSPDDLDTAIAGVVLEPYSDVRRMNLGRIFATAGLPRCALEQYAIAAHLATGHTKEAIQAAREVGGNGNGDAASPAIRRVLDAYQRRCQ